MEFNMAGDLESFLKQAAERLAQQINQAAGKPVPQARQPRQVRKAEREFRDPEIVDAEMVDENERRREAARRRGPDPLSEIDTRERLAQGIDQADERMAAHIHQALDHDVMNLKTASQPLTYAQSRASGVQTSASSSEVQKLRARTSHLIDMLRNPETLRQAFIVSEIFNRKF